MGVVGGGGGSNRAQEHPGRRAPPACTPACTFPAALSLRVTQVTELDAECPVPRNPREVCQDQKSNIAREPICAGRARNRFATNFHSAGLVRGASTFVRGGRETGFRSRRHLVRRQHGSPLLDEIYRSVGRRRRSRGADDELHICERRAAARVQRGPRITDFGKKDCLGVEPRSLRYIVCLHRAGLGSTETILENEDEKTAQELL